ncbi:hypothetical protein FBU59_005026 [Linderina macrospora]|uniref:Uncharacterized protein n=1 Tax=Linderina macrospora TaxID=4868 RepID=A0ACC1J3W2_9FUNG|nr:hypothetical protein FBU59_005026 [Linderina macrospora]
MHVFFRNLWLIQWVWITMGVIFLFFIALFTYLKMSQVWQVTRDVYRAPEKLDLIDDETISSMTEERKRYIRSVTLRVTFYPLIPVITQIWLVANSMMLLPPYWLFVMCYLMPSAQGILNFLVYTMNPALDIYRKAFVAWITGRREKQEKEYGRINHHQSASELHDDNALKSVRSKMSVETNV